MLVDKTHAFQTGEDLSSNPFPPIETEFEVLSARRTESLKGRDCLVISRGVWAEVDGKKVGVWRRGERVKKDGEREM